MSRRRLPADRTDDARGDAQSARADDADVEVDNPWFARLYSKLPLMERLFAPHRAYLARELSGRVLDVGAGDGGMFEPVREHGGDDLEYHAVEPDPNMRERAIERARGVGMPVDIRDARAEALPYPEDSFDVVLSSVVFCTVQDPERAVDEVARVLKPGGEFRFFEHVRADGWRERGQDLCNPVWKRVAAGCNVNRPTVERFVSHEAFDPIDLERVRVGAFPASPFVRGRLHRRR